jgi:hypothetical protein
VQNRDLDINDNGKDCSTVVKFTGDDLGCNIPCGVMPAWYVDERWLASGKSGWYIKFRR